MKATLRIGKSGIDAIIDEARTQLKARGEIKVRVNRSLEDKTRRVAEELASRTNSRVVDVRGKTFILGDLDVDTNSKN